MSYQFFYESHTVQPDAGVLGLKTIQLGSTKIKLWQNSLQNASEQNQTVFVASESPSLRLGPNQYQ